MKTIKMKLSKRIAYEEIKGFEENIDTQLNGKDPNTAEGELLARIIAYKREVASYNLTHADCPYTDKYSSLKEPHPIVKFNPLFNQPAQAGADGTIMYYYANETLTLYTGTPTDEKVFSI